MVTTVSTLQPPSFLQPTGYKLVVNRVRFPNLEFFAQSVNHPSINLAPAIQQFRGVDAAFPGDKIDYQSEYDIRLLILTSGNVLARTITYKSAFPTFIGDIEFASTPGTLQYISFPMTFKFTSFSFT